MSSRKQIADRTIARWKLRGFDLAADVDFMAIVDLWIEGLIGASEMRLRYAVVVQTRVMRKRETPEASSGVTIDATGTSKTRTCD